MQVSGVRLAGILCTCSPSDRIDYNGSIEECTYICAVKKVSSGDGGSDVTSAYPRPIPRTPTPVRALPLQNMVGPPEILS